MKAAVVTEQGVQYKDAPKPSPKPNEILIKVRAASLNRADLAVASGHRHGSVGGPGTIVGLECAGEVEAVGAEVKDFKPGDRVMSSAAGGFAEYAVADSGRAHKVPAIVNVGRLGGMKGEFNFDLHALKRIDYIGVTFRTRSPEEVRAIVQAARKDLWPAIEAGKLSLPIDKTFPLAQAAEALAHMKANAHFGKIVLVV
jgi:NADPH:quinone reductase-like Zn-dependent oxidoreductase